MTGETFDMVRRKPTHALECPAPRPIRAGVEMERTRARTCNGWDVAGLILALVAALALWALVLGGVLAPLDDALARIEAGRERATLAGDCPPAQVTSSRRPMGSRSCPESCGK